MIIAPIVAGSAMSAAAMGGAGIGAGAAAGASAGMGAAMGAALFNPVTIGLAVVMGGLMLHQGMQQKKAIKRQYSAIAKSAYANLDNLNDQILQVRRAFYDQTDIQSQGFRQGFSSLVNSVGSTSGGSVTAVMAAQVANANLDQLARRTALSDTVSSIEYEKKNVKAQSEAGMESARANYVPAGIQAIQGGLQGIQMGMQFNSVLDAARQSAQLDAAYQSVLPSARAGDSNALAQLQALNAGVPPSMVMGEFGNLFTAPYLNQMKISSMQTTIASNDLFFSTMKRNAMNNLLGSSLNDRAKNSALINMLGGR